MPVGKSAMDRISSPHKRKIDEVTNTSQPLEMIPKRSIDEVRKTPQPLETVRKRSCINIPTEIPTKENADYFLWSAPEKRKKYKKSVSYSDFHDDVQVYDIDEEFKKGVAKYRKDSDYWRKKYQECFECGIYERIFTLNAEGDKTARFVHLKSNLRLHGWQLKGVVTGRLDLNWKKPVTLNPLQATATLDPSEVPAECTCVAHAYAYCDDPGPIEMEDDSRY
jgi:hypothetical protein